MTDQLTLYIRIIQRYLDVTKCCRLGLGVDEAYSVAIALGESAMLPTGLVCTISRYLMKARTFNELACVNMIEAKCSNRHPLGQLACRIVRTNPASPVCSHQLNIYSDIMISLLLNYGVMRWVPATTFGYLTGKLDDPSSQTQDLTSNNTDGITCTLLGSNKLSGRRLGACCDMEPAPRGSRAPVSTSGIVETIFFASTATLLGDPSTVPYRYYRRDGLQLPALRVPARVVEQVGVHQWAVCSPSAPNPDASSHTPSDEIVSAERLERQLPTPCPRQ
ncbi:hypothetical protein KVR01_008667 [Diaporthe batatas]|uniref:uncharacterized protein n=1 Tax=Diaporthe batatas TaxID=748121 RepID=UPI001D03D0EF|nr:uncharacterized protein KVR01_008667 [Diaporthe batatas]KAG8161680.1 hypothetical protein KVR01_008667 [Diaporthe batatas]